jgi:hypothetical protein
MVVVLLCACLASPPPQARALAEAYDQGLISVKPWSLSGASEATLEIRNDGAGEIRIDVNGSYLKTRAARLQRLGIGLVRAGKSDTSVTIPKAATVRVNVLSVCMDEDKPAPQSGEAMDLARELAPREARRVLAHWKRHPAAQHRSIQRTVWKRIREARVTYPPLLEGSSRVLSRQGRVFLLKQNGELFSGSNFALMENEPGTSWISGAATDCTPFEGSAPDPRKSSVSTASAGCG